LIRPEDITNIPMQNVLIHDEAFERLWEELTSRIAKLCETAVSQRDDAWYAARRKTIGGSEIYKLMNLPYKDTPYLLARQKIRGNPEEMALNEDLRAAVAVPNIPRESPEQLFATSFYVLIRHRMHTAMTCGLAMHWGSVFEDVINNYMKQAYGLRVDCENMFYNPPGPFSYSPDGVTLLPAEDGSGAAVPTLLEYKCPFTRVPGAKIPPEYVAQMSSGMELLGLEQTLYSEAVFRLCTWEQLGTSTDCRLDLRPTMRVQTSPPLACGFFGVYGAAGILESDSFDCLGRYSVDDITVMFSLIAAKGLNVWYSPLCLDVANAKGLLAPAIGEFTEFCRGGYCGVGVLCWKLFSVSSQLVLRCPGFLDNWRAQGEDLLQKIEIAMNAPDPEGYLSASMCPLTDDFFDE
jgi:YqaJ-like viral recombinase domain